MFKGWRPQSSNQFMHIAVHMSAPNLVFQSRGIGHVFQSIRVIRNEYFGTQHFGNPANPVFGMERGLGFQ